MSIALDTALFLREQKLDKPLTAAERGLLFTLMFRVGSNPFTWVSQKDLCLEMDMCDSSLRRLLKSIEKKGLLVSMEDPQDKRKNLYRPSEFLINYHQEAKRNPTKSYPQKQKSTKNYRSKFGGTLRNTAENSAVNTAQNSAVINCTNDSQHNESKQKKSSQNFPKDKYKTKYIKQKQKKPFYDYENQERYKLNSASRNGLTESERANGIKAVSEIMTNLLRS